LSLVLAILVLGLCASISPSTLVVFIMLLATTRAHANAAAFLVGWTISLVIVFAVSYVVGGDHSVRTGGGHAAVNVLEILVGLGLVYVGTRKWHRRHEPRGPSGLSSNLTARIERLSPKAAVVLGILEQPWTLTVAAAVVVVHDHTAFLAVVIAFAAFTAVSTATVAGMYVYFARRPDQAEARLQKFRDRLVETGPALFAAVAFLVGLYLVVDGAVSLAGQ
jgi:Sap, sulfolipid-1-addressing protein